MKLGPNGSIIILVLQLSYISNPIFYKRTIVLQIFPFSKRTNYLVNTDLVMTLGIAISSITLRESTANEEKRQTIVLGLLSD